MPNDMIALPDECKTRSEVLDALADYDNAIKALEEKGGKDLADLTEEDAATLENAIGYRDELRAKLNRFASVKARLDAEPATHRPHIGGAPSKGTGADVKATDEKAESDVKALESEYEKFVKAGPFKSLGHFMTAVRLGNTQGGGESWAVKAMADWRDGVLRSENAIKALYGPEFKAASGMNEFADSEGGVLVPVQLGAGIWKRALEDDFNFLNLPGLSTIPVSGNSYKVRARQDKSRADGSRQGGAAGYWTGEASQYTSSKPTYRTIDLRLNKLTVLIYATDEMLEDSVAAEAEINSVASDEFRFKINDAMFRGTGVGMPLGLLNATAKVTVATSGGGASTITGVDIDNMWARRSKPSGQGFVWLCNQDTEPQLAKLNYTVTNSYAASWAYVPGTAFNGSGLPTLKGKPVYYTEQNESLGTEGDIVLLDPSQYAVAVKSTGIQSAVSLHLRFDYGEQAFRFAFRMDARPYWETSLTRFKGSNALSPIITFSSTRT